LSKNLGWAIDPYISASARTSLTKGFDYKVTPELQTADFFDPGYLTQAIGFLFKKEEMFITRLGVSFQETFADKFATLYSDDETTKEKN